MSAAARRSARARGRARPCAMRRAVRMCACGRRKRTQAPSTIQANSVTPGGPLTMITSFTQPLEEDMKLAVALVDLSTMSLGHHM